MGLNVKYDYAHVSVLVLRDGQVPRDTKLYSVLAAKNSIGHVLYISELAVPKHRSFRMMHETVY